MNRGYTNNTLGAISGLMTLLVVVGLIALVVIGILFGLQALIETKAKIDHMLGMLPVIELTHPFL